MSLTRSLIHLTSSNGNGNLKKASKREKKVSNLQEISEHGDETFQLEAAGIIARPLQCFGGSYCARSVMCR